MEALGAVCLQGPREGPSITCGPSKMSSQQLVPSTLYSPSPPSTSLHVRGIRAEWAVWALPSDLFSWGLMDVCARFVVLYIVYGISPIPV